MKLIHLTDTHLVPQPATLFGLDPRKRLDAALKSITQEHPDADLLVITGDLAHWGELLAYDELQKRIATNPIRTVLLIGNHDERSAFRRVFPEAMDDGNGFVQGSRVVDGHRLIFLDTKQQGTHAGAYCAARLAWLEKELSGSHEPTLLFMHHPAFPVGMSSMDLLSQQDASALWQVLEPHADRI
ncbi:hypothetical protein ATN81_27900, partial [Agrobacterium pusense]